jgi:hypothetical protein
MRLAKAHSEKSLAAHIYHGWTISNVCRDAATGTVSEHVLRWDLPEAPRNPTTEEIGRFIHISTVEDKFAIKGRGVVIAPGLPRDKAGLLKHEDFIVLFDYEEDALLTQIRSIELSSPPSPKGWGILLPFDVRPEDIKIGMQVWARNDTKSEQDGGGNSAALRASP